MSDPLFVLTLLACLGCALMGGVFFAFSSFVMKALGRLPSAQGIAAMQSVNAAAITPAFMTALFAPAAACVALLVFALVNWSEAYARYLLAGSVLYLAGAIGLTVTFHVPRNEALARVDPHSPDAARLWRRYLGSWTAGNHVRALAALAAAAALAGALAVR